MSSFIEKVKNLRKDHHYLCLCTYALENCLLCTASIDVEDLALGTFLAITTQHDIIMKETVRCCVATILSDSRLLLLFLLRLLLRIFEPVRLI